MKQHDFELRLMKLWTSSRVPLTKANLLAYTKAERPKMEAWLDAMVREGLLEVDSDDDGELLWRVRGSSRPTKGLEHVGDVVRLEELSRETDGRSKPGGPPSAALARTGSEKPEKSVLVSSVLSFFFGPLGWLYAGPLKEAIPGAIAIVLLSAILPKFILVYVLSIVSPLSAIAGALYAWSYNRNGRRMPLIAKEDDAPRLQRPR